MSNSINQNVVGRKLAYNNFNLSEAYDTSGRIGKLIPVYCREVVPGDLMEQNVEFNIRFAPLSAPAMARFSVHFHSFYVPSRIVTPRDGQHSTWERFIMGIGQPIESVTELPRIWCPDPQDWNMASYYQWSFGENPNVLGAEFFQVGSLWDYFKLPVMSSVSNDYKAQNNIPFGQMSINILPFLCYLYIWSSFYRRDQIEPEVIFPLSLGYVNPIALTDSQYKAPEETPDGRVFDIQQFLRDLFTLRTRNYERDYFTSGLPEPQFGDDTTLGGDANLVASRQGAAMALAPFTLFPLELKNNGTGQIMPTSTYPYVNYGLVYTNAQPNVKLSLKAYNYKPGYGDSDITVGDDVTSDRWILRTMAPNTVPISSVDGLSAQYSFTINELRMAFQIQGIREKINRGGTRYIEILHSIYGVRSSDLRLQRPQYLGGCKAPISIGAVLQTSSSTESSPQGRQTGIASTQGAQRLFRTKHIFEEHGYVMTIMSITPRTGYFGGVPRMFSKFDPIDYYTPDFDRLGEQETLRQELYYDMMTPSNNTHVAEDSETRGFAYNPRYQEYKSAYSTATGEFRTTLDNWNVLREFDAPPSLSADFIHAEPEDFDRIFEFENVRQTSNEHFYAQIYFDVKAKRPMSKYSTPYTLF